MEKALYIIFKAINLKRCHLLLVIVLGSFSAFSQTATATDNAAAIDYTLAYILITVMVLLLIIIGFLSKLLEGSSEYFVEKWKKELRSNSDKPLKTMTLLFFFFSYGSSFAADPMLLAVSGNSGLIGGLPPFLFYLMLTVVFIEFMVVMILTWQIWRFISAKKNVDLDEEIEINKIRLNWWDKFNKFKPLSSEADLDLGHDYDGIRELDNKLPPWWLYGFYLTIIVGVIYFYRYNIAHTGLSGVQEYEASVIAANKAKDAYLKKSSKSIDENSVTLLTDQNSIAAGMANYKQLCSVCHGQKGEGLVGPNLTDGYWIYGGGVKDIFKTIKYGTNKGMQSWKENLTPEKIAEITGFIKSINGSNPPNPKAPDGILYTEGIDATSHSDSTTDKQ